jgi:hypothetical protein
MLFGPLTIPEKWQEQYCLFGGSELPFYCVASIQARHLQTGFI